MSHPSKDTPTLILRWLLPIAAFLLLAPALGADWLITKGGLLVETDGAWTIDGDTLTYKTKKGDERQIAVAEVNLEASEKTTALRAGKQRPAPSDGQPKAKKEEPKVQLYMTSWCGYCRKTRELLTALKVPFAEKDIERDPAAAQEYRSKGQGYSGIPLVDIDGTIIKGFNAGLIQRLVSELQKKEARGNSDKPATI